jgi:hypothetical protein
LACVDKVLEHCENVSKTGGIVSKCSYIVRSEFVQLTPMIAALINEQACECLHSIYRVSDAQLGVAPTTITSDCDEGRLFTENRYEANGVSDTVMDKSKCLSRKEEDELGLLQSHILIVCDVLGRYVKESLEYRLHCQRSTSSKMR